MHRTDTKETSTTTQLILFLFGSRNKSNQRKLKMSREELIIASRAPFSTPVEEKSLLSMQEAKGILISKEQNER